jgi:hypothetical protein
MTPDPTDLHCTVCGTAYGLNEARVTKALRTLRPEHGELAKLCWVCVRLKVSVEAGACADRCPLGEV